MGPTDEELVAAFQQGDASAFDELVSRWDRKIHGAIYRVVGADEDARDLCQEAFLKAYRGRTAVSLDDVEDARDGGLRTAAPSPLELLEARDLRHLVQDAMATLSAEEREVVILKEYQELTFPEIAEALEMPLSTVKTRLYRGLAQLRHRLERQGVRGGTPVPAPIP